MTKDCCGPDASAQRVLHCCATRCTIFSIKTRGARIESLLLLRFCVIAARADRRLIVGENTGCYNRMSYKSALFSQLDLSLSLFSIHLLLARDIEVINFNLFNR